MSSLSFASKESPTRELNPRAFLNNPRYGQRRIGRENESASDSKQLGTIIFPPKMENQRQERRLDCAAAPAPQRKTLMNS
jgi:hypothetical protein